MDSLKRKVDLLKKWVDIEKSKSEKLEKQVKEQQAPEEGAFQTNTPDQESFPPSTTCLPTLTQSQIEPFAQKSLPNGRVGQTHSTSSTLINEQTTKQAVHPANRLDL